MAAHVNAAYRVVQLIALTTTVVPGETAEAGWIKVFGITPSENQSFEVARKVLLLREQIYQVQQQMKDTEISPPLYERAIENALRAVTLKGLEGQWGNERPGWLNSGTLTALQYCSELIPHEEDWIAPKEFTAISEQLETLKKSLDEAELSASVRAFILTQITILETAIGDYPIRGRKAFEFAVLESTFEAAKAPETSQEAAKTVELATLRQCWAWIRERNTDIDMALKIIAGGSALAYLTGSLAG